MSHIPFKQGDRVEFKTVLFSGTGLVVGMALCAGFRNIGVLVQYETLELGCLKPDNPFLKFSVVVVPLYDETECTGHAVPAQIRLLSL
jgi:hypothetical protein